MKKANKTENRYLRLIGFLIIGACFTTLSAMVLGNIDTLISFSLSITLSFLLLLIVGIFWISAMIGLKTLGKTKSFKIFNPLEFILKMEEKKIRKETIHKKEFEKGYAIISSQKEGLHFVAAKDAKKFHLSSCKWVNLIKPENKIYFQNLQQALACDYVPCQSCNPDNPNHEAKFD